MARPLGKKLGFMLLWPGLFLYFFASHRTRVILTCGDEILLIQDASRYFFDTESWALPGGVSTVVKSRPSRRPESCVKS